MRTIQAQSPGHIVFVHGAGGGGWEWTIWQHVFSARGWSALAPDLMPAANGLDATRLQDYADQVCAWCEPINHPVLVGASLGGLLAVIAAARIAPSALVLINPIPPASIEPRPPRREYADLIPWGRERSLSGTRRALPDADDAACLFAFRRWRDESGAVMREAAAMVDVQAPDCPLLLMASELDTDIPAATTRAFAYALHADFRLLRGASHVGPLLGRDAAPIARQAIEWIAKSLRDLR